MFIFIVTLYVFFLASDFFYEQPCVSYIECVKLILCSCFSFSPPPHLPRPLLLPINQSSNQSTSMHHKSYSNHH